MKYLDTAHYERFDQDGYLVIPGFLGEAEVARVERGIADAVTASGVSDVDRGGFNLEKVGDDSFNTGAAPKRRGMMRKIQGAVFEVPALMEVFTGGRMLDCMEDLMGPEIYYHSSKVFFKSARGGCPKPWHQDAAYWAQFEPRQITVWIAIHDADVGNGCVWAIPGSHRLGLVPHIAAERQVPDSGIDLSRAVPVPVPRGGLLIFHSLVLHMSQRNESDRDRWAIICDYDCLPNPPIDLDPRHAAGLDERGAWPLRSSQRVATT
jgi:ectoine hydroxylase-related dioxygenase (phytanoyl-CoA dioxygenase family)